MDDDRFDAIVVGAGPAGITAAKEMAAAGLSVVVLERGQFPGAKNVWGGILYREPTEAMAPGFEEEAPLERPIVEQRYLLLTEDAMMGATYRSQRFAEPPFNAYSVLRSPFDRWYATKAEEAGAEVYAEFTVVDLLWEDGAVVGVTTGDAEGELLARCVVIADGANSLLAQKIGLHREWEPIEQALVAKELIALPAGRDRGALRAAGRDGHRAGDLWRVDLGAAWLRLHLHQQGEPLDRHRRAAGRSDRDPASTSTTCSTASRRTRRSRRSSPAGRRSSTRGISSRKGATTGCRKSSPTAPSSSAMPRSSSIHVNREGGNLAMLSGKLAAQAIVEAKANDDFSAMSLSRYRELLDESVVMADLHKIRNVTDFAHARPHLLRDYPQVLSAMFEEYLRVDGVPKKAKQKKIIAMAKALPKRRLLDDLLGAARALT